MLDRLAAWLDRLFWPGLDVPRQPCLPASEVVASDDDPAGREWLARVQGDVLFGICSYLGKPLDELSKNDVRENYEHGLRWIQEQNNVRPAHSLRVSLC